MRNKCETCGGGEVGTGWGQDVDEVKLFTWQEQGTYLKDNLIFSFPLSNKCTCVQIVIIHAQDTSFPNKLKQRSPKITMCTPNYQT